MLSGAYGDYWWPLSGVCGCLRVPRSSLDPAEIQFTRRLQRELSEGPFEHFSRILQRRNPVCTKLLSRPELEHLRSLLAMVTLLFLAAPAFAQANGNSPWENAVNVLQLAFTSTIARGLSLVAIVVSGLTFAFGEGGSKRVLSGVLFGVGMAIAAVNFLAWLFP
jgi:type IV secretory pathway VirB2 component (pilin)